MFTPSPSPPPPPAATVVPLSPINNNRTSALRASLRMKKPAVSDLFYSPPKPIPPAKPSYMSMNRSNTSLQFSALNKAPAPAPQPPPPLAPKPSRPSVLQLFTSALSRSAAKPPSAKPSHHQSPETRCDPEGLESKLSGSSCTGYTPALVAPAAPPKSKTNR